MKLAALAKATVRGQAASPARAEAKPAARVVPRSAEALMLASILAASPAMALDVSDYEKLTKPAPAAPAVKMDASPKADAPSFEAPSFEAPDVEIDPVILGAGVGGVAVIGLAASLLRGEKKPVPKGIPARKAFQLLEAEEDVRVFDIRAAPEVKAMGSPDTRAVKKSLLKAPLFKIVKGEPVPDGTFAASTAKKIPEGTAALLIDADGSTANSAAKALIAQGCENVFFVQGGARAWEAQGLPWKAPSKGFSLPAFDLRSVTESIDKLAEDFRESPDAAKGGLAVGALAGAGFLLFNELEVVMELVGAFAVGNLAVNGLLFADKREETLGTVKKIINEDIKPTEAGDDLKAVARALFKDEKAKTEVAVKPTAAPAKTEAPAKPAPAPAPAKTEAAAKPAPAPAKPAAANGAAANGANKAANGAAKAEPVAKATATAVKEQPKKAESAKSKAVEKAKASIKAKAEAQPELKKPELKAKPEPVAVAAGGKSEAREWIEEWRRSQDED